MSIIYEKGYLRHTGNSNHGNKNCRWCGNQIPKGFQCHHGEDVQTLLSRINLLEITLRKNKISLPL